jgi:PPOX class probable F420-dependent enzyme
METIKQFSRQKYLNLETFRKSGVGVKTPVWFVQEDDIFYVTTFPGSGKVKRIRRDGRVNIAPCRADGGLKGVWVPAFAIIVHDKVESQEVGRMMDKKYGLLKKLLDIRQNRNGSENVILRITIPQ